jgi:hypothetical protein
MVADREGAEAGRGDDAWGGQALGGKGEEGAGFGCCGGGAGAGASWDGHDGGGGGGGAVSHIFCLSRGLINKVRGLG